jgi:YVTN family beta-propeller protein
LSLAIAGTLVRVYVPNRLSGDIYVIDPTALKVVDRFKVGVGPQHVVPAWDLRALWVTNNGKRDRMDGSLTPSDP